MLSYSNWRGSELPEEAMSEIKSEIGLNARFTFLVLRGGIVSRVIFFLASLE